MGCKGQSHGLVKERVAGGSQNVMEIGNKLLIVHNRESITLVSVFGPPFSGDSVGNGDAVADPFNSVHQDCVSLFGGKVELEFQDRRGGDHIVVHTGIDGADP